MQSTKLKNKLETLTNDMTKFSTETAEQLATLKAQMEAAENRPVFDLTLTTEVRKIRTLIDEMKPTFDQTVSEQANLT